PARANQAGYSIGDRPVRRPDPGNAPPLPGPSRCRPRNAGRCRRRRGRPALLRPRRTAGTRPAPRPAATMTAGQSRYRMRRHARRLRRYGLEPIAIVNPGDPLPEIAIVVIGRWLWHYRSELTPATVSLAIFGSAWLLHRSYAHWWPMIASAAIATAALAVIQGARVGLVTSAERWYA